MRRLRLVLLAALGMGLSHPAVAQTSDQLLQYCGDPHPEVRLLACTIIINGGQEKGQTLADTYTARGTAYSITGDELHAIEDFSQALQLDPSRVLVLGYRGDAYLARGDYDRAIADFSRAVQFDPDYTDGLYGRASAYRSKGDNDRAIADYSTVIERDPKYAEAFAYRGVTYLANDQIGRAIDDFDTLINLAPNNAQAFNLRGSAYLQMGENARAMEDYDRAVRADPDYAPTYYNRGIVEFVMGRFADAVRDFTKRIEAQSPNTYAALWLHIARRKTGTNDTAEFTRNAAALDLSTWPGPVVRLYQGQATPEDVRTSAKTGGDAKAQLDKTCQAAFYIAEYQMSRGNVNAAVPVLSEASISCPHNLPEYDGATAELARLP